MTPAGPPQVQILGAGSHTVANSREAGAPAEFLEHARVTFVNPALVTEHFIDLIPRDFARDRLIISQGMIEVADGGDISYSAVGHGEDNRRVDRPIEQFCISESTSPAAVFNAAVYLDVEPRTAIADDESIARAIDEAYQLRAHHPPNAVSSAQGVNGAPIGSEVSDIDRLISETDRDLLSTSGKGPIIKLVDALIFDALGRSASDVHIHPLSHSTLVRYRVDGVLHLARELSTAITPALISRIKVMGRMDIAERRIPQDGRASVTIGTGEAGRNIDLRISTLPTTYGERVVIRLLDNTHQLASFHQIGMPAHVADPYLECARAASGMILLTGPTGSGKTTTLYATLRTIGSREVNVMTIEDPIEYELSANSGSESAAISQSQVNSKKGITFATGLRHILRQDPDIIMVGEIRDGETARIAIQSSLTGHLVLSTLHTNDAASAITRLVDLGVEPYLVGASMSCVLAQRLVRFYHSACMGGGCKECFGSGFRGRSGLFELLAVDEPVRGLIAAHAPLASIRELARSEQRGALRLRTLFEDGQRLVQAGLTSMGEVQRVVQGSS